MNHNKIGHIIQYQDMIAKFYPYQYDRKKEKNKIQTPVVTFQVTDACNLCCTYCYQINKSTHVMSFDTAKKFIELLLDNNNNTKQYIDTKCCDAVIIEFIGGEPFLQVELIDQIMDYFIKRMIETNHPWQYNWRISISSNGTLYFNPKVQNFIKKWMNHLSFNISIDGNKELHDTCRIFPDGSGSYDIAMKAVQHYIHVLGGQMGSKMTLAPANIKYTYEAIKSLIESGYEEINLNCVFEEGWTVEHAKILYNQLIQISNYLLKNNLEDKIDLSIFKQEFFRPKLLSDDDNWCGGTGGMIAVDWKGDIYPCIRYMESSLGEEVAPIIIGNVNEGIMVKEEEIKCVNCLKAITRITQSTDECIYCPIAEGCAWCSALNYQENKMFDRRVTHICIMHKARALANAYYWNSYFIKHHENKVMKIWLPDEEALKIISQEELNKLKGQYNFLQNQIG